MKIFSLHPHRSASRFVEWKGFARYLRAEFREDVYGCRASFHDDLAPYAARFNFSPLPVVIV